MSSRQRAYRAASVALMVMASAPHTALAQTSSGGSAASLPAVFHTLAGAWVGEGTLLGRPARFEMRWTIESATRARLTFKNGFLDASGSITPVLEALAIYTVEPTGGIVAHWTDDRPQEISISAEVSDSVVVSEWTAESERGRTEYLLDADGTVRVRDWVLSGGGLEPFGEARYRRAR